MDFLRIRLLVEPKIDMLIISALASGYGTESSERITELVEGKLDLVFPEGWPPHEQERVRQQVRALIKEKLAYRHK